MKLNLLNTHIDRFYREYFPSRQDKWLWIYERQHFFANNWRGKEEALETFFNEALTSDQSKRLWKLERYRPKEMLLKLIRTDPGYTLLAFQDLFNEEKDVAGRLDRFIFYADELLGIYRKSEKRSVESNHYQDYTAISLYLSLRHPARYVYYRFDLFKALLETLGSLDLPEQEDPERYFKLMRTVHGFLQKHPGYPGKHLSRLKDGKYHKDSMWVALEFLEFSTNKDLLNF